MNTSTGGIVLTAGSGLLILAMLWSLMRSLQSTKTPPHMADALPSGYVLQNITTHARILPVESPHAFSYSILGLLLSLNALEAKTLDLGRGWIFGYGGIRGRLTGLRPDGYLSSLQPLSIRDKLIKVLDEHGLDGQELEDAWMLTMPSFFGYEGINPLTVHFCYRQDGNLWTVVLEVHNTFGERHVYVLETERNQNKDIAKGYDYQWTFPRQFHVSPFNNRAGYYTVSIAAPTHPPPPLSLSRSEAPMNTAVRIHYYDPPSSPSVPKGPLRLTAVIRSVSAAPFTSGSLLRALATQPFALVTALPRILYQAWILHYVKRLDVFARPEPHDMRAVGGTERRGASGRGVFWLPASAAERRCERRFCAWLARAAARTRTRVVLRAADPAVRDRSFGPSDQLKSELCVSYTTARVFASCFLAPSAPLALRLTGLPAEKEAPVLRVSDEAAFCALWAAGSEEEAAAVVPVTRADRFRLLPMPESLRRATVAGLAHPMDVGHLRLSSAALVLALVGAEALEETVVGWTRARFVPGDEPWLTARWTRVARTLECKT